MIEDQLTLALIAIGLGVLAGIVLLVPFVAISYRRRGTLTLGRALVWAAALVYSWAIWTYTLLPLPDPDQLVCAGSNLVPGQLVIDVLDAYRDGGGSLRALLTSPVALQLVLNVVLFIPLGFFIRFLGARGVVVAALVGLAVSGFVELTQLTGVWGLYPCAYRVFDVDDLLMNTGGAVLGSWLGLVIPRRLRGSRRAPDADLPRPVTKRRRLLAMVLDLLGTTVLTIVVSVAVNGWLLYVADDRDAIGEPPATLIGPATAAVVWLAVVLATGRTVGDIAVRLDWQGGPQPAALERPLRFLAGIGGYTALGLVPGWGATAATVLALVVLVAALATERGRGLPGLVTGNALVDDRDQPR